MFIQTEETPNANAVKFLPGTEVSPHGPVFYGTIGEVGKDSDLAVKLFHISGIEKVFFGYDFITVTKSDNVSWEIIKPEILMTLMDHFVAGLAVFNNNSDQSITIDISGLSELEKQIVEIIETRVRPSVAMDGGDIIYKEFKDGIVYLEMRGACSGCPSSTATLKNGIESMLKHYVPEVQSVEAINAKE